MNALGPRGHLLHPCAGGRHHVLPVPAQSLADRRIALAPFGLELLEPDHRHVGVLGPVDRLDRRQDRLAVLPGNERRAVPDQMQMHVCTTACGNTDVIASGKPLSPSTTAMRMSLTPRALSSLTTFSQNLAPSVCSIHGPRTSFSPSALRASAT